MSKVFARAFALLLLLAVIIFAVWGFLNRTTLSNWFKAQQFQPSAQITAVSDSLGLTDEAETLFYSTHPTISGTNEFQRYCANVDHSENGHVLGCFTSTHRIHLFRVNDERLHGIVEVTAAHELLHAAWSQLPAGERDELISKLLALFAEISADDPDFAERMSVYEHLDENSFANELHSVLGTEVANLPDWLEQHYQQWFHDRSVIIDLFDNYHSVFRDLQAEVDQIQARMHKIKDWVETESADYEKAVADYNAKVNDFNRRNQNFEFSDDPESFANISDSLKRERAQLDARLEALHTEIDEYESLRTRLQQISQISTELNDELSSGFESAVN